MICAPRRSQDILTILDMHFHGPKQMSKPYAMEPREFSAIQRTKENPRETSNIIQIGKQMKSNLS